jgi:Ca2+-transporting ATPase
MRTDDDFPARAHARAAAEVAEALGVDPGPGLTAAEAGRRLARYGPNRLAEAPRRSAWVILFVQFQSLVVLLLAAAAAVSFAFGDWIEGLAIFVVIAVNTAIGFTTELQAVRSMEALRRMARTRARARRDGVERQVDSHELVPGDVVVLEGGDLVPADVRLLEASKLLADESTLTGESVPVDKRADPVAEDAVLGDRTSMLYLGTALTRGAAEGLVVATGRGTELGRIATLAATAGDETTPLEVRLEELGRRLIWVTLVVAALVAVVGIAHGRPTALMIETAIALAVAAIPEGLPIVATIALARGMLRLARRNALVRRLSAVETLGGTSVICVDKTGTLTENRMRVVTLVTAAGEVEPGPGLDAVARAALEIGALCNDAALTPPRRNGGGRDTSPPGTGDPLEIALLEAADRAGIERAALLASQPEEHEEAFDPELRMMATAHRVAGGIALAVKGAPEAVLAHASHELTAEGALPITDGARAAWLERACALTGRGLRVIALARREMPALGRPLYRELGIIALCGIADPPRPDVRDAVGRCRSAGVRVVMMTGDHPGTARAIAAATGIASDEELAGGRLVAGGDLRDPAGLSEAERARLTDAVVFARVSPKQKLDLVKLHQAGGAVIAMTGDGVNDAPALRQADIGIAMGQRGTQVAREAADMVLSDDRFGTIVAAVEQGRVIFGNIRSFVVYLMSCNLSEVLVVSLATLLGLPLPLLPLQILFLNLVTDVFPALALGAGPGPRDIMQERPRPPGEPLIGRRRWLGIAAHALVITCAVLAALWIAREALGLGPEAAVTVSFLTLAMAQLWHVFNLRQPGSTLLGNDVVRNPWVLGALLLCSGLLLLVLYVPALAAVLKLQPPSAAGWATALGASVVPLVVGQASLAVAHWRRRGGAV